MNRKSVLPFLQSKLALQNKEKDGQGTDPARRFTSRVLFGPADPLNRCRALLLNQRQLRH